MADGVGLGQPPPPSTPGRPTTNTTSIGSSPKSTKSTAERRTPLPSRWQRCSALAKSNRCSISACCSCRNTRDQRATLSPTPCEYVVYVFYNMCACVNVGPAFVVWFPLPAAQPASPRGTPPRGTPPPAPPPPPPRSVIVFSPHCPLSPPVTLMLLLAQETSLLARRNLSYRQAART